MPEQARPKIVVICGSTRFRAEIADANRRLTLAGCIVLAPGVFGHDGDEITDEQKEALDDLHFRKIDLADEVYVVNPGGYIGESTRLEMSYARRTGKPIHRIDGPVLPPVPSRRAQATAVERLGGLTYPDPAATAPLTERPPDLRFGLPDLVGFLAGNGRHYQGERSDRCPGDGVPGHRHDIRCIRLHASPNCACGVNDAGQRYVDPICQREAGE